MTPVGIGLVGVGMWGRRMAAAAERAGGVDLVTCFARDEGARSEAAETFGCRAAGSLDALLDDSDVEAVLVVAPNHTHAEIAVASAERGKHVFVEKPFADRLADGLRAAEAIQRAGVLLFVGHSFRRLGAARAAATAIGPHVAWTRTPQGWALNLDGSAASQFALPRLEIEQSPKGPRAENVRLA